MAEQRARAVLAMMTFHHTSCELLSTTGHNQLNLLRVSLSVLQSRTLILRPDNFAWTQDVQGWKKPHQPIKERRTLHLTREKPKGFIPLMLFLS